MALIRAHLDGGMRSSQPLKKCQEVTHLIISLRVNYVDVISDRGAGAPDCADEPGAGLLLRVANRRQPFTP
jgi:hypothetical protein